MTDISEIKLQAGDIFLSYNNWFLGNIILKAEKFWSKDNKANYGHGGIILDSEGKTFEALCKLRHGSIKEYMDGRLLIARPKKDLNGEDVLISNKLLVIKLLEDRHLGNRYPFHRLLLHLIPPLAKYFATGRYVVCTELVAKYLSLIGVRHDEWAGTNPDNLADEIHNYKNYEIIYEGGI